MHSVLYLFCLVRLICLVQLDGCRYNIDKIWIISFFLSKRVQRNREHVNDLCHRSITGFLCHPHPSPYQLCSWWYSWPWLKGISLSAGALCWQHPPVACPFALLGKCPGSWEMVLTFFSQCDLGTNHHKLQMAEWAFPMFILELYFYMKKKEYF